jgi:enoyl-[acyl-carrier-protein] reductase (NADH)
MLCWWFSHPQKHFNLYNGLQIYISTEFPCVVFLQEVAESVKQDYGSIDILVHSLANGPEVK